MAAIALAVAASAFSAASAVAEFGITSFDVQMAAAPGAKLTTTQPTTAAGAYTQAAGHPYSVVTHIEWNSHPDPYGFPPGVPTPDGDLLDSDVDLPPGLVGNPTVYPQCTGEQLAGAGTDPINHPAECPVDSQVGLIHLKTNTSHEYEANGNALTFPIFNMVPATGSAARFGTDIGKVHVYFDAKLTRRADGSYGIALSTRSPQALRVVGADVTFWGIPADERHFAQRCSVLYPGFKGDASASECSSVRHYDHPQHASVEPVPFLTMPTSCTAPGEGYPWTLHTSAWENPGFFAEQTIHSHLPPYAPAPSAPGPEEGTSECHRVPFSPDFSAIPTQQSAAGPSGLELHLDLPSDGILNPDGIAQSHLRKAVITLPEGITANPSLAEGLGVCSQAEFNAVSVGSYGCPSTAKLGNVEVKTPLLEETIPGNVYIAEPYKNPSKSLLALYIVLREPQRGIAIGLAGKVEPDPRTGQLITTFDDLPQVPFESFEFKFREGPRAPLITPSRCGRYEVSGDFYSWARPAEAVRNTSIFQIHSGPNGGPCPHANIPPFNPGFTAGSLNNNAGSYSPFLMRLTRADGEQDLTKFNALLPPGVSAKLAGLGKCSESAIALAKEKTGTEEREAPSCPANAEIGNIIAGAGVGSTLIYVPGKLYLAGPYNGAPLSVVAITPGVAGPFDVGTVLVRVALSLDPVTAKVRVDGERSDPIPHILAGIPLSLRDLVVKVDRPNFTITPTSCDRSQVGATLFGSYLDVLSPHDDVPVAVSAPYQAANCLNLGFKPALSLKLTGGTKRGQFPGLKGELRPRAGDANPKRIVVTLPPSSFLEQAHIRTICTRVQYAAKACPPGSIYGHVKAWTPLLDEPLQGPVYLRSSSHKLPDMVLSLSGLVDVEAVGKIDSKKGGIRATFDSIPDAPLTKVLLTMQGAKKGLIVNSTNLCKGKGKRANAQFDGQNGKARDFRPALKSTCKKHGNAKRRNRKRNS